MFFKKKETDNRRGEPVSKPETKESTDGKTPEDAMERLKKKSRMTDVIPHFKLRLVLFIIALIVAVGGITLGVMNIGRMKPGFYEIKGDSIDEASLYQNGFQFNYYLSGNSGDNRSTRNELRALYMSTMLRSYKLTDPGTEYENYVNLATLNKHPNEAQTLDAELYDILKDAYAKTLENSGFSVFAGPFYSEWTEILYLDDPFAYDPLLNPEEAEKLAALAEAASPGGAYAELIFEDSERKVTLKLSDACRDLLARYDVSAPVLDLNLLRDAYRIRLLAGILKERGYDDGYIAAESGLTAALDGFDRGGFALYALPEDENGKTVIGGDAVTAAEVASAPGRSASVFRAFGLFAGDPGYYSYEADGINVFRGPSPMLNGQGFLSSMAVSDESAVEAVYRNICLNTAAGEKEALDEVLADPKVSYLFTLPEDLSGKNRRRILMNGYAAGITSVKSEFGFYLEEAEFD